MNAILEVLSAGMTDSPHLSATEKLLENCRIGGKKFFASQQNRLKRDVRRIKFQKCVL